MLKDAVQSPNDLGNRVLGEKQRTRRIGLAISVALAGSLCLNAVLLWKAQQYRSALKASAEIKIGAVVPPIQARAVDGANFVISYFGSDRPTVLYFFSPACDWCELNLDNIKRLVDQRRGEYSIIGISLSNDDLHGYITSRGINFPVCNGLSIEAMKAYKLGKTPQTIVVSTDGRVLANWIGNYEGGLGTEIEKFFKIPQIGS